MKNLFIFSLLLVSITLYAQEDNSLYLYQQMQTVEKLCKYDNIAWRTSDSIIAAPFYERSGLGPEWFCIEENNSWYAYYGRIEEDEYKIVFNYKVNQKGEIERIKNPIANEQLNRYAFALNIAFKAFAPIMGEYNITFNQYIFQNPDTTFDVYFLPAFQTNNIAVYGGEFKYTINTMADSILKQEIYFPQNLRGFYVNKEEDIRLDYNDSDLPTIGALFFGWYYKQHFNTITIETKKYNYKPIYINNTWSWMPKERTKKELREVKKRNKQLKRKS